MEEVESEIRQNLFFFFFFFFITFFLLRQKFVDFKLCYGFLNYERNKYVKRFNKTRKHRRDTKEVKQNENLNSDNSELGPENIERAVNQSCPDVNELLDWELDKKIVEDFQDYEETDEAKRNVRYLLYLYRVAIQRLFDCVSYHRVEEFGFITQEILKVKIKDLQEVCKENLSPFLKEVGEYDSCDLNRPIVLLCISRIFLTQDKKDHFRFLCSLVEDVLKNQSEGRLCYYIECYLEIQLLKNPSCTFDYLCTGISVPKFECKLKLFYCTKILSKYHRNASDKSIEENLIKYFILNFDEVMLTTTIRGRCGILSTLKHNLNKLIAQKDAKNIKITLEVLQKTIRHIVIDDCFKFFIKYIFGNKSFFLSRQQKLEMIYVKSQEENLLRSVCGSVIEFLQYLKLIEKKLHKDMQVAIMLDENKCILRCLVETLSYILVLHVLAKKDLNLNRRFKIEKGNGECIKATTTQPFLSKKHEERETILPIYIETFLDYMPDKKIENIIKEFCKIENMIEINKEIILKTIYDIASLRYHKQPCELAIVILDINLTQSKGDLLFQITHTLWNLLKIQGQRKSKTHLNTFLTKLQHKTILYRCICILRNAKKQGQLSDVNIASYTNAFHFDEQSLENEDQVGKKSNTEIMLIIMLLLLVAATRHHKSAKLKKYLSQKYEYKEAILYILWCSGDIHINPGPPMKKSRLLHDSQRERAWIQDMSSILLKLYKGEPPHTKPKNLWREKPDHWPSNKPFYDTKNHPHDESGCFVSDNDLLECLIQCCDCKKVYINNVYRNEIAAWRENRNQLLYKLYTFRTETEKIKMVLQNFTIYKDTDELNKALDNINVKLSLKVGDSELKYVPCKRVKNQSEMIADITRFLATVVCKIIKGKDPESKCDGIWTTPPEHWPMNVPFFSPFNRGKCKHTCSDQLLLSTLLQHSKAVIPPKYKSLVESYQNFVNSTDKKEAKKHKEVLCRVKTIQTDVSVLDYALKYLHSDGFFTPEIYHSLRQWWTHENVENQTEITFANLQKVSEDRPKIRIEVTRKCVMLSVNMDYPAKSLVCYGISLDDSLPTTLDSNSQHCSDVDQLCNDDNLKGTSVKKNLQIPNEQKLSSNAASLNESDHGTDTTQYSIINNDNETDSSKTNEPNARNKLLPVESNSLSLSELEKSKEIATSITVKISKGEETLARNSDGTNQTADVSGINHIPTGQCGDNERVIVPETNESEVLIEKQSKGKKRKLSNEDNDNGMKKPLLMESDIKDDSVHKKTGVETVPDHQFDIDFLLEGCIDDISFQHDKSTSELSKNNSSLGSAEDEIMDTSFTDYDEVSDGLELLLDDLINYESGKTSRLEKELLLDS